MKSRFGTPTPVAGSGTEEEFNNAFEKWKSREIDNIDVHPDPEGSKRGRPI